MNKISFNTPIKKIGVLLVNLGTPDQLDIKSIRSYLTEFLSDKRVIDLPRLIWYPILYGIILRKRPTKTLKSYQAIWDKTYNESPLRLITKQQTLLIEQNIKQQLKLAKLNTEQLIIEWAMRYGTPKIEEKLDILVNAGCEKILCFPVYPQYCAATTATVCDKVFDFLKQQRHIPAIRTVPAYYDHPLYIKALADSILEHLTNYPHRIDKLLVSFHGIPKRYSKLGDPYEKQCLETTKKLAKYLNWKEDKIDICFQSQFGKEEWLQPYTEKHIKKLAQSKIESIAIISPGFVADCLETLHEINIEYKKLFQDNGGKNFTYIKCLNDSEQNIQLLTDIILNELQGWLK
ncbi:ferrochelatase [Bartonella sp. DGB1]|uniref:ferrochelatase n=1 Tax=Bartonella sp. DGB1 TaxID=3239807 RepID=UPI0035235F29